MRSKVPKWLCCADELVQAALGAGSVAGTMPDEAHVLAAKWLAAKCLPAALVQGELCKIFKTAYQCLRPTAQILQGLTHSRT